jgi:hypothetical protein
MGWWETRSGAVIGDPPANLLDELGATWERPNEIPPDIRARIEALYVEDLGRKPTEDELAALLSFHRG